MTKIKYKLASSIGCVLEWYDFAIFGFFAPLLSDLFFPSTSFQIGLIKTFLAFSIGFFARPFGAIIFGIISDKFGRTVCLKITPLLITLPTLFISVLPTYAQIGVIAPIALIFLRIIQGVCIGGEFSNNILYLCESTNPRYLYFSGSIGACTGSIGILLASFCVSLLYKFSESTILLIDIWRVAFFISFPFGIFIYIFRKKMIETPIFEKLLETKKVSKNPLFHSMKSQRKEYLVALGLSLLPATAFYFTFFFLPNYINNFLNSSFDRALLDNSSCLLLRLLAIPIIGVICDSIGGILIARLACFFYIFASPILFYYLNYFETYRLLILYIFSFLTTLTAATTPGLLISFLKPETRATVFSLTFNISFGIFGSIAPSICIFICNFSGNNLLAIAYLMLSATITLATTYFYTCEGNRFV